MDETTDLNNQTVTMSIPLGDANTPPIVETIQPESYPQINELDQIALRRAGVPIDNEELSTENAVENIPTSPPLAVSAVMSDTQPKVPEGEKQVIPAVLDPNRDEKGQFIKGNTASVGNEGGRPCDYCRDRERLQKIADDYINKCEGTTDGKASIPFQEELALKMRKYREILIEWEKKKTPEGVLEHPEFANTIKRIESLQRLRLMQRTLGRYNPTGAIFQLKANHGFMESEKRVIAGDKNEPLQIEIIEEKPKPSDA